MIVVRDVFQKAWWGPSLLVNSHLIYPNIVSQNNSSKRHTDKNLWNRPANM